MRRLRGGGVMMAHKSTLVAALLFGVLALAALAVACGGEEPKGLEEGSPAGKVGSRYEVTVGFNESYRQADLDEVAALLEGYDESVDFLIQESFPPTGRATLQTGQAQFCTEVEQQLGDKAYVREVRCAPEEVAVIDEPPEIPVEGGQEPGQAPEDLPRPPALRLVLGDQQAEAGIGTYCWSAADEGGMAACVDAVGVITPQKPLRGSAGDVVTAYLPDVPVLSLSYEIRSTEGLTPLLVEGGFQAWPPTSEPLASGELPLAADAGGGSVSVTLPEEPGSYVVSLFMQSEGGDVVYGFLAEVR